MNSQNQTQTQVLFLPDQNKNAYEACPNFCQFWYSTVHYIYLFKIRNTTESAGGLAKSHCAVKGTFCGRTDRFTTQMFINRGNINELQRNINQQYFIGESISNYLFLWASPPEHLCTSAPLSLSASTTACFQFPAALLLSARTPAPRPQRHTERSGVNMVIGGGDW